MFLLVVFQVFLVIKARVNGKESLHSSSQKKDSSLKRQRYHSVRRELILLKSQLSEVSTMLVLSENLNF